MSSLLDNRWLVNFEPTPSGMYKAQVTRKGKPIKATSEAFDLAEADSCDGLAEQVKMLTEVLAALNLDLRKGNEQAAGSPVLFFEVPKHSFRRGSRHLVLRWDLAMWECQPLWRSAAVAWLPTQLRLPQQQSESEPAELEPRSEGGAVLRSIRVRVNEKDGKELVATRFPSSGGPLRQPVRGRSRSSRPRAALEWLLKESYRAEGLRSLAANLGRHILAALPGGSDSLEELAQGLCQKLNTQNRVGQILFDRIAKEREDRLPDIQAVQAVSALEALLAPVRKPALPHFVYLDLPAVNPQPGAAELLFPEEIPVCAERLALALRSEVDVLALSSSNLAPSFAFTILEHGAPRVVLFGADREDYLNALQENLATMNWLQAHWSACQSAAEPGFVPPIPYLKLADVRKCLEEKGSLEERLRHHLAKLRAAGPRPSPLVHARIQLLRKRLDSQRAPKDQPHPQEAGG